MAYVVKTCGSAKLNPKTLNIDGSEDPFYRYKMRQLFIQVVGKGKMIKTVLLNVDDVSKDLKVAPSYMTAYFGYEIGAQSKYDGKKPDRERASISGERDPESMNDIMAKFIKDFVLCPQCKLPETSVSISKSDIVFTCHGCGSVTTATEDLRPKFKTFIINHPQDILSSAQQRAQAAKPGLVAQNGKGKKTGKKKGEKQVEGMGELPDSELPGPADAASPRHVKDDDWAVDTSAAAVAARRENHLPDKFKELVVDEGGETAQAESSGDYMQLFRSFVTKAKPSHDEIVAKILQLQESHKFSNADRTRLFCQATFKPGVIPKASKVKPQLEKIVTDEACKLSLLECLEMLFPSIIDKVSVTLKGYYDEDILDEDVLLLWYKKHCKDAQVKKKAAPFMKWLEEAEEESSEEDEE